MQMYVITSECDRIPVEKYPLRLAGTVPRAKHEKNDSVRNATTVCRQPLRPLNPAATRRKREYKTSRLFRRF